MDTFDVAVIGTGPGGYVAAIRAAQRGLKVVAVEQADLGGTCLNTGCIPTKTYIHSAHLYHKLQNAKTYGLKVDNVSVDMPALVARKNKVVEMNRGGIDRLFKTNGVTLMKGSATISEPGAIEVNGERVPCRSIIIATGSSPAVLPGLEPDGKRVITSTEALELTEVPKRAAVIGGGAIGAEFASLWHAFGADVTLIEAVDRLLPVEDAELSTRLQKSFTKRGIDVRTSITVSSIDTSGDDVRLTLSNDDVVEADIVLMSVGRRYHSGIGSDIGVDLSDRGAILTDDRMQTSVPGVYAIGDVVGQSMLAHCATMEGVVAAENTAGGDRRMDYRVLPACTFTMPEVASVGLSEAAAIDAGYDVRVGRFDFAASGRALTMGETEGLTKIVADATTDEILGVHIMGPEAGELISAAAMAMQLEATVEEIAHTIHTHPTLAETMMEAAEDYYGIGIHTPPPRRKKSETAS
jgi:dihydrolipoamide dehydrogenase